MASTRNDIQRLRQQQMFQNYGSDINDVNMSQSIPSGVDMATDPDMAIPTLRSRSIFDRSQVKEPSDTGPKSGELSTLTPPGGKYDTAADIQEIMDAISKVYTPQTRATDRFNELLDNPPERNEPGIFRKIVAGGVALGNKSRGIPGGIAEAEKVLQAPYLRDAADWKLKAEPFQQAERDETTANVNERTLAGNVVTAIRQTNQQAEQSRIADEKNEIARKNAESTAIRARAYAFKNEGWDIIKVGDRLIAVNPNTRQREDIGPSGLMDREAEINLLGAWNVKRAQEQGANALTRAEVAGWTLFTGPDGKPWRFNTRTGESEPAPLPQGTTRIPTPRAETTPDTENADDARRRDNARYAAAYNAHPELQQWIQTDVENGRWGMKPAPTREGANPTIDWWTSNEEIDREYARQLSDYNYARKLVGLPPYSPPDAPTGGPAAPSPAAPSTNPLDIIRGGGAATPQTGGGLLGGLGATIGAPSAPSGMGGPNATIGAPGQQQQQGRTIKLTPEQVRALTPQQIQELQSIVPAGRVLAIASDGTVSTIPNTPEAINAAPSRGVRPYPMQAQ